MSGVWIRTQPDIDGVYRVTLEINDDTSQCLDAAGAMAHARAVLATVARAEYDAAVVRQMTKVGRDRRMAAELVGSLRGDRPPVIWPSPLELDPGVSASTGDAFLRVVIAGEPVGQWEMTDAREHALAVLEAVETADLDGGYLRALRTLGVDESRGRAVVGDLATHRTPSNPDS